MPLRAKCSRPLGLRATPLPGLLIHMPRGTSCQLSGCWPIGPRFSHLGDRAKLGSWANPLPLKMEECESWVDNDHHALRLVGYFGRSLRWNDWDYERHPPFNTFCSGVMKYILSPMELRMDPELQRMFPRRALAALTNPLQWRSPETR